MTMTAVLTESTSTAGRARRRRARAVVLTALVLVAAVLGLHWYSGLTLLVPYAGDRESGPVAVGRTVYVDSALGPLPTTDQDGNSTGPGSVSITITRLTPHVDANTSGAVIRVLVCERNGGRLAVGMQYSGLSRSCTSVVPVTLPMTLDVGYMTAQVVVEVTPRRPGTVHIAGFDVDYTQGLRHGTQRAGAGLTLTTS